MTKIGSGNPMIIAVDGPAASGKGTLCRRLANHFGLALLDTGLIYRAVGLKVLDDGFDPSDKVAAVAAANALSFQDLDQKPLRSEEVAAAASQIAIFPEVRGVLLKFQRKFAAYPPVGKLGAVLDGRDIGTVIFPEAKYKIFLIANPEVRAARRYKELQERGSKAIHSRILQDMKDRDATDTLRSIAPLKPAKNAFVLDTSNLSAEEAFVAVLKYITAQNHG